MVGAAAAGSVTGSTLVVGATGAVGGALLRALAATGTPVLAWSRRARADDAAKWQVGELFEDALPAVATILCAGPLDGLVAALARSPLCRPRVVVALSSSSATFKRDSLDADERGLAAKLAVSEAALLERCRDLEARCVILRPTLIYGGEDAGSLGAIEALARRFGFVVLPRGASGLRMPIHADDVATAMLGALESGAAGEIFDVGGGETLTYDAMIRRVLEVRGITPRLVRVPDQMFRALLRIGHRGGLLQGLSEAMVLRMRADLVVDDTAARRVLGHAPGPFRPRRPL